MTRTTIRHDSAGFLLGTPVELQQAVEELTGIREDIRAIRQAVTGSSSTRSMRTIDRAPVTPMRQSNLPAKSEMAAVVNHQVADMVKLAQAVAKPTGRVRAMPERGSNGRFIGRNGNGDGSSGGGGKNPRIPNDGSQGLVRRMAAAFAAEVSNSEEADPSVKAFKEVAEPLKRGYGAIAGDRSEKRKDGWFRRIFGELQGIRVEQSTFDKAAVRSLKSIEDKPVAGSAAGGAIGGLSMSNLLSPLSGLGSLLAKVGGVLGRLSLAIAPLLAILKIKELAEDTSHDKELVDDIQKNIADPLKRGLKTVGIDKDAEIEAIRQKNQREQNGADEYERMDRARAAVAAAGVEQASPEYQERLSRTYQELERQDADAKKGRLAKAWDGVRSFGSKLKDRAFGTGAAYTQGNIAGLDDAHTRSLVASTAATESSGGRLNIVNDQGYMGRYQAGAGWLADAGLIRGGSEAVRSAMRADGFKSEWKWASAGGMSKFLDNPANWVEGMSKEKYLASADLQDAAFKINSDKAYADLVKRGAIQPGDSQDKIAGLLKARHLAGLGGAMAVAKGDTGPADANGTTARKYFNDLANDAAGFTKAYQAADIKPPQIATPALPSMPALPSPPTVPDAPAVEVPLSSGDTERVITLTPPPKEVGQDLSNRRIAHIVTGGYADV